MTNNLLARRSCFVFLMLTALFGPIMGIGKDAGTKPNPSPICELYLKQLASDGFSIRVIDRGMDKETFPGWKRFLTDTFRVSFLSQGAERVVFTDANTEHSFALFVFHTPREFTQSIVSFRELTMFGALRSKASHVYYAVANETYFAILLSEQILITPDSLCVALSKVIRDSATKDFKRLTKSQ